MVPGQTATVVVSGTPGDFVALAGSAVGAGLSAGGAALALGADIVVLRQGQLDATRQTIFRFVPPFLGATSDRYDIQAGASPNASFSPLSLSGGRIVLNADLAGVLIGPRGADGEPGPVGPRGPAGPDGPVGPA